MDSTARPSEPEPEIGSYAPDFSLLPLRDWIVQHRLLLVVVLVVAGLILVASADSLGIYLVRDSYGISNIDSATRAASTLRNLGFMLFGMGLLERVLLWWETVVTTKISL